MGRLSGSLVAVAATAVVAIGCGSEAAKRRAAYREVNAPWKLTGVAGRVLTIRYDASGCLVGNGRALVREAANRVEILVKEQEVIPAEGEACTRELRHKKLRIHLDQPLRDRAVVGGPRLK
jgi:hypothetical protein